MRMRIIKIISLACLALLLLVVLLLAIATAYLAATFDADRIKHELAQAVWTSKQRTLRMDGTLHWRLWPAPEITMEQVSLSEHNRPEVFAQVESAHLALALAPLFLRRIEITELTLKKARVQLVRNRDGRLNIDDLISSEPSEPLPFQVFIAPGTLLHEGALTWRDEQNDVAASLHGLTLTSGGIDADLHKSHFAARSIKLSSTNGAWHSAGQAAPMNLAICQIHAGDIDFAKSGPTLKLRDFSSAFNMLQSTRKLELTIPDLALHQNKLTATPNFGFSQGAQSDKGYMQIELKTPLSVDLNAHTLVAESIVGRLRRSAAPSMQASWQGQLQTNWAKHNAQANLDGSLGDTHWHLTLAAQRFSPPALTFDLNAEPFNADPYLAADTSPPAKPQNPASTPAEQRNRIDLSAFKTLDLAGRVRVKQLTVQALSFRDIALDVTLRQGKMRVRPTQSRP